MLLLDIITTECCESAIWECSCNNKWGVFNTIPFFYEIYEPTQLGDYQPYLP